MKAKALQKSFIEKRAQLLSESRLRTQSIFSPCQDLLEELAQAHALGDAFRVKRMGFVVREVFSQKINIDRVQVHPCIANDKRTFSVKSLFEFDPVVAVDFLHGAPAQHRNDVYTVFSSIVRGNGDR